MRSAAYLSIATVPVRCRPRKLWAATGLMQHSNNLGGAAENTCWSQHQLVLWLIRFKIAASTLYGPAPAEMTTISMNAYKVSGR